ncbi:hypothetical protein, partial [Bacillus cereus]|uniref:hypothetical protein n=1 Tax=Bacillus cereus TaxID=1396 RepID=UPI001C54C37A
QNKKENLLATPNRNSSPTYRWATPFTRLRKENYFGKFVKIKHGTVSSLFFKVRKKKKSYFLLVFI